MKKILTVLLTLGLLLSIAGTAFGEADLSKDGWEDKTLEWTASYQGQAINFDVVPQEINGITMFPLRAMLEEMGYVVKWDGVSRSVEISKDAQWTKITIGENSYFKNKMAPTPLSHAPILVENRTMVPAEFFPVILDKGLEIEKNHVIWYDDEYAIHTGKVKEITHGENGKIAVLIATDLENGNPDFDLIIHTSEESTIYNVELKEGELIHCVCSPIMLLSIPGQTSGYILYK
jgi:hypothetical protein